MQDYSELFYSNSNQDISLELNETATSMRDFENHILWLILLIPIFTIVGNVLVIMGVARERNLKTATNYFIGNLAVADLLVAVFVMPFGVYYTIMGKWGLSAWMCDIYLAMDVIFSTSSIYALVSICIDRYIAVTMPVYYNKTKELTRVYGMVTVSWLLSTCIGLPILLGLNNTNDRKPNECKFNHHIFVIISSIVSFYIPAFVMIVLYGLIFKGLMKLNNKNRERKQRVPNSGADRGISSSERTEAAGETSEPPTRAAAARLLALPAVAEETGMMMTNLTAPIPAPEPTTIQDSGYYPSNLDGETKDHVITPMPNLDEITTEVDTAAPKPPKRNKSSLNINPAALSPRRRFKSTAATVKYAIRNAGGHVKFPKLSMKKEKKATKTIAIVLSVFLVCWTPFFLFSTINAVSKMYDLNWSPKDSVVPFSIWLGYINSMLNPLIYAVVNPEFRKAFMKYLCFCCRRRRQ